MSKYTDGEKQQLRDFVREGIARVAVYMKTTMGFPEEMFFEEIDKMQTLGQQMVFLENFYKEHPKIFKDMPHFKPEHV